MNIECNTTNYGNELTTLGTIEHANVHKGKIEKRGAIVKVYDMQVFSTALSLIGRCDIVEFTKATSGAYIPFLNDYYTISIVEHKRAELKCNNKDVIQLTAQAMCLEEMFKTKIPTAYLYFKTTNQRRMIEITCQNKQTVIHTIASINNLLSDKVIPDCSFKSSCKRCAAFEICNPLTNSIQNYLNDAWRML